MTTKKSTNGLQKKEQELKGKPGTLAGKKNKQQESTATKQKLKKLEGRRPSKKETKALKQPKKSTDEKVSKRSKKDSTRRGKFCSQQRTTTGNVEMPKKKDKKIKNQLAKQEIFENSNTPLEVNMEKKGDVLELPNIVAERRWKSKAEKEDEDDTLFNIDPIMPDMDLPSLRLNNKTD